MTRTSCTEYSSTGGMREHVHVELKVLRRNLPQSQALSSDYLAVIYWQLVTADELQSRQDTSPKLW